MDKWNPIDIGSFDPSRSFLPVNCKNGKNIKKYEYFFYGMQTKKTDVSSPDMAIARNMANEKREQMKETANIQR